MNWLIDREHVREKSMRKSSGYGDIYNRYAYISNFRSTIPRLPSHNYQGPGVYHVILCAQGIEGRAPLFEHPHLRQLLQTNWLDLPHRFPSTQLDEFTIMPDHLHFLIWPNKWPDLASKAPPFLWEIICAYKSKVALEWIRYITENHPDRSAKIWQRGYYERVVRIGALENVRRYIRTNPDGFLQLLPVKHA